MWYDNDKIMGVYNDANNGKISFPGVCPECKNKSVHLYINKHNDEHCGIWTWCSKCGASSHMSAKPPLWWENLDCIDCDKLCSNPDYLNSFVDLIDKWVMAHLPVACDVPPKPFIMENRFMVCFKKEYLTIKEGTVGTLIINDDFKCTSIFFINSLGEKIAINTSTEKLMQIVEVIK